MFCGEYLNISRAGIGEGEGKGGEGRGAESPIKVFK